MKKYMESLSTKKIIKDQSLLGHEDIRHKIRILPELQAFIPPLLPDELKQLESNIRKDGCREALLVWPTTEGVVSNSDSTTPLYVLVDGHNRYGICQRNGVDFRVNLVDFDSLEAVRNFMLDNQLGRRNLTPEQTSYLRGLRYLGEKGQRGKYDRQATSLDLDPDTDHKGQNVLYDLDSSESSEIASNGSKSKKGISTAEVLAKQFSVNEKTIKRDAEFAAGLEKLTPALKAEVLAGKSGIKKAVIQQLAKSDAPTGSISSPDTILSPLPAGLPVKAGRVGKPDALQKKLRSLVDLLDSPPTNLLTLCDDIIACATKLKNTVSENH
ncbi:hypothetical protein [Spirosoma utsteinense]|uniref:ParB/Sulfiredoxin domain-containing protein n=1 Tax=Spirosoma utsteinense TaxID=2585773 RepID=A0ABR6WDL5_9BACT|nr:hypothetical protein [Spirosoma utsteinense]MBC3787589.1 hypothetical protein [Spirosoma utsteinense]MBC3794095.1 hypothetical protein [Spirosoma utsteinense]